MIATAHAIFFLIGKLLHIPFRKLQILISQTTDSHFANYRYPFRKLQISISQTTDFHFVSSHFVSQTTVSHLYLYMFISRVLFLYLYLGQVKKKMFLVRISIKKKERAGGFFFCYLLFPIACFLYTLLPSSRDTLELLGQILIKRNITY